MKPIADDSVKSMAGMAGAKDKLLKTLAEEDATEREL
jgi:hypothetical protein